MKISKFSKRNFIIGLILALIKLFWDYKYYFGFDLILHPKIFIAQDLDFIIPFVFAFLMLEVLVIINNTGNNFIDIAFFTIPIFYSEIVRWQIGWVILIFIRREALEGWGALEMMLTTGLFIGTSLLISSTMAILGYLSMLLKNKISPLIHSDRP